MQDSQQYVLSQKIKAYTVYLIVFIFLVVPIITAFSGPSSHRIVLATSPHKPLLLEEVLKNDKNFVNYLSSNLSNKKVFAELLTQYMKRESCLDFARDRHIDYDDKLVYNKFLRDYYSQKNTDLPSDLEKKIEHSYGSMKAFISAYKSHLQMKTLDDAISALSFMTSSTDFNYLALNAVRQVQVYQIHVNDFKDKSKKLASSEKLLNFYQQHLSRYVRDQEYSLQYVVLDPQLLSFPSTDQDLQELEDMGYEVTPEKIKQWAAYKFFSQLEDKLSSSTKDQSLEHVLSEPSMAQQLSLESLDHTDLETLVRFFDDKIPASLFSQKLQEHLDSSWVMLPYEEARLLVRVVNSQPPYQYSYEECHQDVLQDWLAEQAEHQASEQLAKLKNQLIVQQPVSPLDYHNSTLYNLSLYSSQQHDLPAALVQQGLQLYQDSEDLSSSVTVLKDHHQGVFYLMELKRMDFIDHHPLPLKKENKYADWTHRRFDHLYHQSFDKLVEHRFGYAINPDVFQLFGVQS